MCFGAEEHPAKNIAPKMLYVRQRLIVLSNGERSHAGPVMASPPRDGLPALADATGSAI